MTKPWTVGTVKAWSEDEGWGILSSPDVPGDVFAHFSDIKGGGYRTLAVGERVEFRFVRRPQDDYDFVATVVRRA